MDRVHLSLSTTAQLFVPTIVIFNRSKIVTKDLFTRSFTNLFVLNHLRLLNDHFQQYFFAIIGRSFLTIPFHDRWSIVSNDLLWRALVDLFERSIIFEWSFVAIVEDRYRFQRSLYRVDERSCSSILFDDRPIIYFYDRFIRPLKDRFQRSV